MSHDGNQKRRGGKSRAKYSGEGALHREALPNVPLPRHRQPAINDRKRASRLAAFGARQNLPTCACQE
jgi:hypothetical protein